jgi:DNA-directed RNA polymerase subunit RPC12/RpoP
MKSCAYCGRENEDNAVRCRECGTAQFVPPASKVISAQIQTEPVAEAPKPECDVPAEVEAALCTSCLFPNLPEAAWCKRCGASISYASIVGPLDAALASGFMWRGAVRGRPKLFVLVSVWALFLPKLLVSLLAALGILTFGLTGLGSLAMLWITLAYGAVAFRMLYQVTRNYITIPPMHLDESGAS